MQFCSAQQVWTPAVSTPFWGPQAGWACPGSVLRVSWSPSRGVTSQALVGGPEGGTPPQHVELLAGDSAPGLASQPTVALSPARGLRPGTFSAAGKVAPETLSSLRSGLLDALAWVTLNHTSAFILLGFSAAQQGISPQAPGDMGFLLWVPKSAPCPARHQTQTQALYALPPPLPRGPPPGPPPARPGHLRGMGMCAGKQDVPP